MTESGIRIGLKIRVLWVRVPPPVPKQEKVMQGLILGFIIGALVTYTFIYPETVKMVLGKVVEQVKKLFGRK